MITIDFVLVDGFAAVVHDCNQTTRDIDICILFSHEEIYSLLDALKSINPVLRNTPTKKSLAAPTQNISQLRSLHLTTDLGIIDVVSHIEGVGGYHDVLKNSVELNLFNKICRVISVDDLIKSKKTLGRHRDLAVVEELAVIKKERKSS
ncbi:MAG: hypothetical protein HQM16_16830 [Deltaproteobacteria bacterium]|nr:hypothetical protein [Deltaproteobacteria bacterium]